MLEIWIGETGVLIRDQASGQSRVLENVQSVTFVDGSAFPAHPRRTPTEPEENVIQTLAGLVNVRG